MSEMIDEVLDELARATAKFPTWPTDPLHALAVLGEEFGELNKAMLQLAYEPGKSSRQDVKTEAIQTAAMALRLAMSLDVYDYRGSSQHVQEPLSLPCGGPAQEAPITADVWALLARLGERRALYFCQWAGSLLSDDVALDGVSVADLLVEYEKARAKSDEWRCAVCGGPKGQHAAYCFRPGKLDRPTDFTRED